MVPADGQHSRNIVISRIPVAKAYADRAILDMPGRLNATIVLDKK